jgi:hypothetical protein
MKELKDYFVTQEQAESLKELGFKEECLAYYGENGEFITNPSYKNLSTRASLIAQAKDWLLDELGVLTTSFTIDEGIERLKALRKKLTTTFTLTFKVYDHTKTYEDGEYLIVKRNEHFPISVSIAYGQIVDSNGLSFDDDDVAFISPSFEVIHE